MDTITLQSQTSNGDFLEATFSPQAGMNLLSFKKNDIEVISQETRSLFDERKAGLGALIGPHFHRRNSKIIPPLENESLFPHIAALKSQGVEEPFSHGIGRYVPWKAEATKNTISAILEGKDEFQGIPISKLQGQDFKMSLKAQLAPNGLSIHLSVVSDFDSVVGFHYYYDLPKGQGTVSSNVLPKYRDVHDWKQIPQDWNYKNHELSYNLNQEADWGFQPFPNPLNGKIYLETLKYKLQVSYQSQCEENSWQLFRPQKASYVCIEPLSATNPRKPQLSVSSLNMHLNII